MTGRVLELLEAILAELRRDRRSDTRLMTPRELADVLRINPRTLRDLRKAGKAPPEVIVGDSPRWIPSVVDRWLAEKSGT